jgi:hypothetical protein
MSTVDPVQGMMDALLSMTAHQALETDDPNAYQAGVEFGARYVLRMLAVSFVEVAKAEHMPPAMSE